MLVAQNALGGGCKGEVGEGMAERGLGRSSCEWGGETHLHREQ